jgi:hypothetical protein
LQQNHFLDAGQSFELSDEMGVGESASRPVFVDDNIARPWTEFRMIKAAADPVVGHSYPSRGSSVPDSLDQVEKLDISASIHLVEQ